MDVRYRSRVMRRGGIGRRGRCGREGEGDENERMNCFGSDFMLLGGWWMLTSLMSTKNKEARDSFTQTDNV
jgi:hypothetical protein